MEVFLQGGGTLVLLHEPHATAAAWGDLPETLRSYGLHVLTPNVPDETGPRYIALAAREISAAGPAVPLVLAAHGTAGPLLPGIALAQRAAHRPMAGYVFIDADLPRYQNDLPLPPDWPEAPCAYLRTHQDRSAPTNHDEALREARLRAWPTVEQEPPTTIPQALKDLLGAL